VPAESIQVLIHPQSIVHSMVEFSDGSVLAQLGVPDMRIPIAYALGFPGRLELDLEPLDLTQLRQGMTFEEPDPERFPCLKLAYQAIHSGGTYPAVLNGANEVAVEAFLRGRIGFLAIPEVIHHALDHHQAGGELELENLLEVDRQARRAAEAAVTEKATTR
jgi:1-deoxy-D-xylulose-5-phosphate reductoisomerase